MEYRDIYSSAFVNSTMTVLNYLPNVDSFLGTLDLKTGSMIISALCVIHPTMYGCTIFMPMSYLLLTIWFLLALFFFTSLLLFYGLTNNDVILISTWICYSLLFVVAMFLMMFLLALFFITKARYFKVFFVFLGIFWYILTIYFILVVNSHRKALVSEPFTNKMGGLAKISDSIKSAIAGTITSLDAVDNAKPETIRRRVKALRKASGIEKTEIVGLR